MMGREVLNHHCGGAVGPMYRKPHFEASRRIARARKKCMIRTAPRMATTIKASLSIVTFAILVAGWLPTKSQELPSQRPCWRFGVENIGVEDREVLKAHASRHLIMHDSVHSSGKNAQGHDLEASMKRR